MLRWLISFCLINIAAGSSFAQELFMISEPASSIPHKALVARSFTSWYDEFGAVRGMGAVSFYYGLTPRISVNLTVAGSNHHDRNLPEDLITHKHVGSQTIYYSQQVPRNRKYPFLIKGANLTAKYRFLSIDRDREHFRMAAIGSYSTARSAHDEAEANLIDDNAGYGAGLIATYLHQRMAFSFTYQYIVPETYEEFQNDGHQLHNHHIILDYGNTQQFNFAWGYLLSPKEYKDYSQTNTNLYVELIGKKYQAMDIFQDGEQIGLESPAHMGSYYVEIMPGIQKVYDSKTILEFSMGLPLIRASFAHATPTYFLSIRRYLYF